MADKKQKQSFKNKYWDNGFNFISIITGIIITFVGYLLTALTTYSIFPPTNMDIITINLINATEIIIISIIGGFISTYIGKEEQLINGIGVGLGIILISVVVNAYLISKGNPNPFFYSVIPTIIATLGYILAPTFGSYLAIRATKRSKNN